MPDSVQRNDAWVFEPPCDFCLQVKSLATVDVSDEIAMYELDGNVPIQAPIFADKDRAQSAFGVKGQTRDVRFIPHGN